MLIGVNFAGFATLMAQSQTSQLLQQILGLVSQHNLQTDLLVAGMDDSGAHVFAITHPGQLLPLATTGFGAIGSGEGMLAFACHWGNTPRLLRWLIPFIMFMKPKELRKSPLE
jgi:hypothetical protein